MVILEYKNKKLLKNFSFFKFNFFSAALQVGKTIKIITLILLLFKWIWKIPDYTKSQSDSMAPKKLLTTDSLNDSYSKPIGHFF